MGKIVNNSDFFKTKAAPPPVMEAAPAEPVPAEEALQPAPKEAAPVLPELASIPLQLSAPVTEGLQQAVQTLQKLQLPKLAAMVQKTAQAAGKERFSVAVVGEFSRGKSSFLNAFLEQEALPVGNLPTTAMLTRIRYHKKPMLVYFDAAGNRRAAKPLSEESWDGLVADHMDGTEPEGTVFVGIPDPWLQHTSVELIDTPGAGDLEQKRVKVIGDALVGADGAIITISATQALSASEQLFIEQRLIARKTPFLMLILTKLDQIPLQERATVIDYVYAKLQTWKLDIPVFLPYTVELPDDRYQDIMGMDKIRNRILRWINDPMRLTLTEQWLISRTLSILSTARDALEQRLSVVEAGAGEREELIHKKQEGLHQAIVTWEQLHLQMQERCGQCYRQLVEKTDECAANIIERLQYEATMSGNPQKWWTESYPYRLKIELSNTAASVDNLVSGIIANDARWFNAVLDKQFKSHVRVERETVADKSAFLDQKLSGHLQFEDLDKQRNMARIGTTALTIAGALACASLGAFPLIATMGISTGSSIVTETVFKDKIEKQRAAIRDAIAKNVPRLLETARQDSESRLQTIYADIIQEAREQQQLWLQTQKDAITQSVNASSVSAAAAIHQQLEQLDGLCDQLSALS